jgi:hypothetical protein
MYFAAAQVCEVDEQGGSGFTLAWSWSRLECGALEVTQREWWGGCVGTLRSVFTPWVSKARGRIGNGEWCGGGRVRNGNGGRG